MKPAQPSINFDSVLPASRAGVSVFSIGLSDWRVLSLAFPGSCFIIGKPCLSG